MREASTVLAPPSRERSVDASRHHRTGFVGRPVGGLPVLFHHAHAAKGPKPIGFGNCWVVAGVVVTVPFLSRPVCLPVLARLWHPRRTGKLAHARAMVELVAARYPDRKVHSVGDAAYVGD